MIRVTDTIVLTDDEIKERFVRAAGPGGQNVNKVATAVELRVDIGRSSLPPDVKERLIALAGRRMTTAGVLVVVSRAHRSQAQNREAARGFLQPAPVVEKMLRPSATGFIIGALASEWLLGSSQGAAARDRS